MNILITGAAGFIGMHLARTFAQAGHSVVGFDNINSYYDPSIKMARVDLLQKAGVRFLRGDISNPDDINRVFEMDKYEIVINLAGQAGVRYSIEKPHEYGTSNLIGFLNILEACRTNQVGRLAYASSSSVYGNTDGSKCAETDDADHPISLYAATKRANELMAFSYSHLYGLRTVGLRFFTVYGPWGRPDMAYFKFAKSIAAGHSIDVYNNGDMLRDFTYIDDVIEALRRIVMADEGALSRLGQCTVLNIGSSRPIPLMKMIELLERHLDRPALKRFLGMQAGDVPSTFADGRKFQEIFGDLPITSFECGMEKFANWFKEFSDLTATVGN